ncbi:MAG: type II secretion system minor pseudopilin GspK [Halioglobus sp.]
MNCPRCKPGSYAAQQGAALVIAMLVFALCATLIVAMKSEFILFYQRGSNIFVAEQAYAYLRGAEDLASMALVVDADQDIADGQARDDLEELWAQPPTPYTLDEGGWLQGGLEDLQGRFNLNQLVGQRNSENGGESYTSAQQQFIRLLQALPELQLSEYEAAIITRSIGDWLDGDNNTSVNGAEDDYYSSQTPSYRTANRPMSSVTELRAVANVTLEIYAALSPWVSVWPQSPSTLNIHTAPAMLLRSINEDGNLLPLSDSEAEALVQQRTDTGFIDVADFLAQPVFEGKNMGAVATLLGEESGYFLLAAEAEVAQRRVRLYSVLERRGRTINTLARASGSL